MSDLKLVKKHLIMIILANELLSAVLETRMQCSVSLETLKHVHQCPQKKEIWEERESIWKCNEINQNCSIPSEFRYHCVRDSYGDLVEVCAPLTNLKGNTCPEYNRGGERIQEDYTASGHCERCPFSYSSNEVYKYSECLINLNDTRTTLNPDLQTSYDTRPTLNPELQTAYNISTTLTSFNQTEVEQTNITLVIVLCIASVIVIPLIILIVRMRLYKKTAAKKDLQKNQEQVIEIEHDTIQPNGEVEMKNEKLSPPGQDEGGELDNLLPTDEQHDIRENNQKIVIEIEHDTIQPNGGVEMKNEKLSPPGQDEGGELKNLLPTDEPHDQGENNHKIVIEIEHDTIQPNGGVEIKNETLSPPGQDEGDDEIEHKTRQSKQIFNEKNKKHSGIDQDREVYNEDGEIENETRQPKEVFRGKKNNHSAIDKDKEGFDIDDEIENVIIKGMSVLKEKNEKLSPLDKEGGKDSTLSLSPAYYKRLRAIQIGTDADGGGQE